MNEWRLSSTGFKLIRVGLATYDALFKVIHFAAKYPLILDNAKKTLF